MWPVADSVAANVLRLKIQPEESIGLQFRAKVPSQTLDIQKLAMECEYSDYFGNQVTNGYETLLYDCLRGNGLLFVRADNVERNWKTVDPILQYWKNSNSDTLYEYTSGSAGPSEADKMLERDGRRWHTL